MVRISSASMQQVCVSWSAFTTTINSPMFCVMETHKEQTEEELVTERNLSFLLQIKRRLWRCFSLFGVRVIEKVVRPGAGSLQSNDELMTACAIRIDR